MTSKEMKLKARETMRLASPHVFLVGLIWCLVVSFGSSLTIGLLTGVLEFGITVYGLRVYRRQAADIGTLFEGFDSFLKLLWMSIRMGLIVFLWSLLFVIPGIIASYRYCLSYLILADHPNWTVKQCMDESCRLMDGKKWDRFCLDLSFIGWYLLASVPFVIAYVIPFVYTAHAVFYQQLIGEKRSQSLPEVPARRLVVQCESGALAGQHRSSPNCVTIGRDPSCDFVFPADTSGISRHHCMLNYSGSEIYLTDLGSSYGTSLYNGMKLQPNVPVVIREGERFVLASSKAVFTVYIQR